MTTDTTEKGLETHIAQYLVNKNGYLLRKNTAYDNVACLDSVLLFEFLEATQPKSVAKLKTFHKDLYEQKIIKRINDQIQAKGVIEVLRKGITDGFTDTKLHLFYDKPVSNYNASANALYQANRFSVMRQVYFSPQNKKSLDLVVFINGIPIISFELKNELTKQNVEHAIKQYKTDRDPNEELFRLGRLIVNFAVDTEEVWMCTQLKKEKTYFLPFNKGYNNGAGNPPNGGIKTDYLWKEILTKSSLTDIIQNFCQLITEEKEYLDEKGKVRTRKEKKLIFPRYHQLVAVRMLLADAQAKGSGQKYLIQHSAGSGKSNSISWLAHQLVGLHDKSGENNIFDTVIVVTDRRVLDAQIRENIKQYQQVKGVVEAITEGSKQLKQALEEGKKIIITTIQKFPHIVEDIGDLPGNNFAIIIEDLRWPVRAHFENGIRLASHEYQREFSQIKSINYLAALMLQDKIRQAEADDALYFSGNEIREATRSNFFIIKDKTVITPHEQILHGITRKKALELSRMHYKVEERTVLWNEIQEADECFLTGTTKKITPVVRIDDRIIADGKPGPVTRDLMKIFDEFEARN